MYRRNHMQQFERSIASINNHRSEMSQKNRNYDGEPIRGYQTNFCDPLYK